VYLQIAVQRRLSYRLTQNSRPEQAADRITGRCSTYCLSYTAVLVYFFPAALVPLSVSVRLLPSGETTMRPVDTTLSPFLLLTASVWSLIFFAERAGPAMEPNMAGVSARAWSNTRLREP